MSSIPEFDDKQLAAARVTAWKQEGEPVLTLEAARDWVNDRGLVLFAPRPAQLPVPAPSLVEATLGFANPAPTAAETDLARSLVSRLVTDGVAVPLNLLGVPGDSPDFVVSAQVFSYVFTLRGDKAWKQPPSTSGAVSVSPLGLRIFEVLGEKGALTAAELASELGREVTETAILRSLAELWSQLRVLPLLQAGSGVTLWELTTRRFTKAIKAGANAGLPTALSALISLYLAQVFAASEEDIETFLSPLTARSRVREVLRALIAARQLETVAVEGRTLLHIPGGLPVFATAVVPELDAEGVAPVVPEVAFQKPKKVGTGRISSFTSDRKPAGEFRGKPVRPSSGGSFGAARKPAFGAKKPGFGAKKPFVTAGAARFGPRLDGKSEPARRPFSKDGAVPRKPFAAKPKFEKPGTGKPSYSKPWNEDRKPSAAASAPDGFTKFRRPAPEDRKPLGPREQAGMPVERRTPPRSATKSFERKPYAAKPFAAKPFGDKPKFGAKPSFGDKPKFGAKRPYTPRPAEDGDRPTFKPRAYEAKGRGEAKDRGESKDRKPYAAKSFGDKPSFAAKKPYAAKPYAAKSFGDKPSFAAKRPYVRKTEGSEGAPRPYAKREFKPRPAARSFSEAAPGAPVERTLPKRPYKPRAAGHDQRPFNKDPWVAPAGSSEGRPKRASKSFGGKKPFAAKKPFGAKRSGPSGAARPASRKKPTE